jgi:CDP-6-deoxy-D-xylo-4-hexulose-3-dehydrase
MPINQEVLKFISELKERGEELFPYIHNNNYIKGKSSIYYSGPYWDEREVSAAITTLLTGNWLSAGDEVSKFECQFSKKFGFDHSLMVNSGSSANLVMIAALKKYFKWDDGDEIIVCVCGFPTTINPIIQNNLKAVFVDINYDDLNWDINDIEKKITTKTRALFSSPVLGNPGNYEKIIDICNRHDIKLIADNCDSLGSKWNGNYLTDYAIASSCSFYPAHHISTIEGGMVSSNIEEIVNIARSFAWWGRDCYCVGSQNLLKCGVCNKRFDYWLDEYDKIVDHKYIFGQIGYNLKPADLQGSIGLVQLEKFDQIHHKRRQNKKRIHKIFESIPFCRVIDELPEAETSWFGVPIVFEYDKFGLVKYLEEHKIQTRNYFAGNILMHPAYKGLGNPLDYSNASKVLDNVFFVGCSPVISDEMIDYIGEVVDQYKSSRFDSSLVPLK